MSLRFSAKKTFMGIRVTPSFSASSGVISEPESTTIFKLIQYFLSLKSGFSRRIHVLVYSQIDKETMCNISLKCYIIDKFKTCVDYYTNMWENGENNEEEKEWILVSDIPSSGLR